MGLTLVSFSLCPYVLRVVAALYYKKINFEIKYIDLQNKPQWFVDISPLEKVPILIVDETKVLFESNVILDYIDTLAGPSLQPADPFEKALQRARAEFAGEIVSTVAGFFYASTEATYNEKLADLKWYFGKLEGFFQGPYLNGEHISLADFSYAPIFTLLAALQLKTNVFEGFPKIQEYSTRILAIPEVQKAKVEDYDKLAHEWQVKNNSYAIQ